jgi:hypothetical protein
MDPPPTTLPTRQVVCHPQQRQLLQETLNDLRAAMTCLTERYLRPRYIPCTVTWGRDMNAPSAMNTAPAPATAPAVAPSADRPNTAVITDWDLQSFARDQDIERSRTSMRRIAVTHILQPGDDVWCYSPNVGFKRATFVSLDRAKVCTVAIGSVQLQGPRTALFSRDLTVRSDASRTSRRDSAVSRSRVREETSVRPVQRRRMEHSTVASEPLGDSQVVDILRDPDDEV